MNNETFKIISEEANLIVSLIEVKEQLKIDADFTADDSLLNNLILASQMAITKDLNRYLNKTVVRYNFDSFQTILNLSITPLISVDKIVVDDKILPSIDYCVDINDVINRVQFKKSFAVQNMAGLAVYCTAGYEDINLIPQPIKQAVMGLVVDLYEHPESNSEMTLKENKAISMLLKHYRVKPYGVI